MNLAKFRGPWLVVIVGVLVWPRHGRHQRQQDLLHKPSPN